MRTFRWLRMIAAGILAAAAVNHATLAMRGAGSVPRHEVFVGVNAALAALLLVRPRWALPAAILASLQQVPSHGQDLVRSLGGTLDWSSLGVVLFFPALVTLLAVERRASTPAPRGAGRRTR